MNFIVGIGWSGGYPARAPLVVSCCTSDTVPLAGSRGGGPFSRPTLVDSELNDGVRSALALRTPCGALPARCLAIIPDIFRTLELADGSLDSGSAGRDSEVVASLWGSFTANDGDRSCGVPVGSVWDEEAQLGEAGWAG